MSNKAIIVKMIRVMMLVPVLLVIAWTVARDVVVGDVGYVVRFRYRQFGSISLFRYLHRAAAYIYFS